MLVILFYCLWNFVVLFLIVYYTFPLYFGGIPCDINSASMSFFCVCCEKVGSSPNVLICSPNAARNSSNLRGEWESGWERGEDAQRRREDERRWEDGKRDKEGNRIEARGERREEGENTNIIVFYWIVYINHTLCNIKVDVYVTLFFIYFFYLIHMHTSGSDSVASACRCL